LLRVVMPESSASRSFPVRKGTIPRARMRRHPLGRRISSTVVQPCIAPRKAAGAQSLPGLGAKRQSLLRAVQAPATVAPRAPARRSFANRLGPTGLNPYLRMNVTQSCERVFPPQGRIVSPFGMMLSHRTSPLTRFHRNWTEEPDYHKWRLPTTELGSFHFLATLVSLCRR